MCLTGFLIKPKRFVGEAIPHFREEPSERVGAAFKAFSQSDGIAKARRIPEDELAPSTAGEKVVIRCFCNMSTVGNLTHVTQSSVRASVVLPMFVWLTRLR